MKTEGEWQSVFVLGLAMMFVGGAIFVVSGLNPNLLVPVLTLITFVMIGSVFIIGSLLWRSRINH